MAIVRSIALLLRPGSEPQHTWRDVPRNKGSCGLTRWHNARMSIHFSQPGNHHFEFQPLDTIGTSKEVRHEGYSTLPLGWTEKVSDSRRRAMRLGRGWAKELLLLSQNLVEFRDNGEELLSILFCDSFLAKFSPAFLDFDLHCRASLLYSGTDHRQSANKRQVGKIFVFRGRGGHAGPCLTRPPLFLFFSVTHKLGGSHLSQPPDVLVEGCLKV